MRFGCRSLIGSALCPFACSSRLDWFDGSASAEQMLSAPRDDSDMRDDGDTAAAPAAAATSYGVLQLRHGSSTLLCDTSLLSSPHSLGVGLDADHGASSSATELGALHLTPHAWYQIIGDVVSAQRDDDDGDSDGRPPSAFVRARVCRELDDTFDAQLYERTVKLHRQMEAAALMNTNSAT